MKIILGADVAGYELKEQIKTHLAGKGVEILDIGMFNEKDPIPYYEVAADAARKIQQGKAERAVLFCGTGMGVAIVANKFRGIYASVVESEFAARHCKVINSSNILTMGGWVVTGYRAKRMVDVWLKSAFTEGYEPIAGFLTKACGEIAQIENETMK